MARLFVAIEMPRAAREAVARAVDALAPSVVDARWVPRQNLHLTLAFLGHTSFVDQVRKAVREAAAELPSLTLRIDGIGAFPSEQRARVLWVGLGGEVEALARIADAVQTCLEPLGFEREERPFTPHVTIARLRMPAPVSLESSAVDPVEFRVEAVTVFESKLQRPAPVYHPLEQAPLSGS